MIQDTKPFVCNGCAEAITKPQNFSKETNLCIYCYKERQAVLNNKCLGCGGINPEKQYWGQCERCFTKKRSKKEEDEAFKTSMMLEALEEKEGWEAVQDYLDAHKDKSSK